MTKTQSAQILDAVMRDMAWGLIQATRRELQYRKAFPRWDSLAHGAREVRHYAARRLRDLIEIAERPSQEHSWSVAPEVRNVMRNKCRKVLEYYRTKEAA